MVYGDLETTSEYDVDWFMHLLFFLAFSFLSPFLHSFTLGKHYRLTEHSVSAYKNSFSGGDQDVCPHLERGLKEACAWWEGAPSKGLQLRLGQLRTALLLEPLLPHLETWGKFFLSHLCYRLVAGSTCIAKVCDLWRMVDFTESLSIIRARQEVFGVSDDLGGFMLDDSVGNVTGRKRTGGLYISPGQSYSEKCFMCLL